MNEEKTTKRYKERVEPRLKEIAAWARDGETEEEIATRLNVAYSTFRQYKSQSSALSAALKNKESYDNEVVNSLHKNTLGGIVKLETPFKCKIREYENGKLVREEEVIKTGYREEYVKPDTMAQMYWLNNRQTSKWKAKPSLDEGQNQENHYNGEGLLNALNGRKIKGVDEGEE